MCNKSLLDLNFDCLLHIMQFCDRASLINLCNTHEIFKDIVQSNTMQKLLRQYEENTTENEASLHFGSALCVSSALLQHAPAVGDWRKVLYIQRLILGNPRWTSVRSQLYLERQWLYIAFIGGLLQWRHVVIYNAFNVPFSRQLMDGAGPSPSYQAVVPELPPQYADPVTFYFGAASCLNRPRGLCIVGNGHFCAYVPMAENQMFAEMRLESVIEVIPPNFFADEPDWPGQ